MSSTDPVTVADGLRASVEALGSSTPSPIAEAETIVGHVLAMSRSQIYLERGERLSVSQREQILAMSRRRAEGEPLQYITGVQSFMGLTLQVGPGVLVPRPETEILVEACIEVLGGSREPLAADIGTGSAAIALSLAKTCDARVYATEVSSAALTWARRNLDAHPQLSGLVELLEGDLFSPLSVDLASRLDLVVSNPPYLTQSEVEAAPRDVRYWEPVQATVSGPTGTEVIARIVDEAHRWLKPAGWLVIEIDPSREQAVVEQMSDRYEQVGTVDDLAGRVRVVRGRKGSR